LTAVYEFLVSIPEPSDFTGSIECMALANAWLEDCRTHEACRVVLENSDFIPSRLISIGVESPPRIRISTREDTPPHSKYMTLSYCWGSHLPIRLLEGNLEDFKQDIPFEELPKTFQDAIYVTRNLGCHYLWIDCLCIIQDSKQDWHSESAFMGDVYSNGECNISAAVAKNSTEGLFKRRIPNEVRETRVQIQLEPDAPVQSCVVLDIQCLEDGVDSTLLNSRAWVLQERILSRRNLIFGAKQIFWECFEGYACEMIPNGIVPKMLDLYMVTFLSGKQDHQTLLRGVGIGSGNEALKRWEHLVQRYTWSLLTRKEDRLVAISGLAPFFQPRNSQGDFIYECKSAPSYLAGLWNYHIVSQLLWSVRKLRSFPNRTSYIAPSWSWSSVDGALWGPRIRRKTVDLAAVDSVSVTLANDTQPFGEVTDGLLVLLGKLATIRWMPENDSVLSDETTFSWKIVGEKSAEYAFSWNENWDNPDRSEGEQSPNECLFLLPLQWETLNYEPSPEDAEDSEDDNDDGTLLGIILKSANEDPGTITPLPSQFVRVGTWNITNRSTAGKVLRGIQYLDHINGQHMKKSCQEVEILGCGDKAHTICIV
jgi:Heterokaryon incompatibility protein (HET)